MIRKKYLLVDLHLGFDYIQQENTNVKYIHIYTNKNIENNKHSTFKI